jgi:N-acetylmuramoyl-L-alanine amidase
MVKTASVKFIKFLLLLIFVSTSLYSSIAVLKKAELKNGELRLQFDKSYNKRNIRARVFKHPYRRVFDIPDARLASKRVGRNLHSSHCRSIRISQYKKSVVRIVIEADKAYNCEAYRPLFSYMSYHIPLPKYKSKKRSGYAKKKNTSVKKAGQKKRKTKHTVKVKPAAAETAKKSEPYILPTPVVSGSNKGTRIVIDAGHGGHDSGAVGGKKREKDLVLQIAKRLNRQLVKRGYRVYMTRASDRFLKLPQRTKIADRKDAKVFISIHANSVPKRKRNKIQGVETFFLQNTRDAKSQRIAARENKAVLKGAGSSLSKKVIIDSVLNGPKIVQSNKLAIDVQKRIMTNLHSQYRGVRDGGVRHAPFWVLVGASRPSILVEVGYISHPKERKRLFTPKYQELIAKGIAEGVENYLNNRKKEIEF